MTSERQTAAIPNPENQSLLPVGDSALTLAAKKLAGSAHCLNCSTELKGPFCYYCGQPDRNFLRFFPALLRDLMEDLLDLDSRFMRTIKPLLFKPGKLTRDYMDGRRFRYAPPMRLYIFSSIVFFLLAAFLSSDSITIDGIESDTGVVTLSAGNAEENAQVEDALASLPADVREQIDVDGIVEGIEVEGEPEDTEMFTTKDISFNSEPWDRETNPVDLKWLPDWLNDRINDEIEGSPKKAEMISENPNMIVDQVFDILPATMFVLLPFVALIFKVWYLFAKRYYVEHLIFSLHNHAFIFVSAILLLLIGIVVDQLNLYGYKDAAGWTEWLFTIIGIWIPIYLFVSLRVVYQQNWFLTIGKFFVIGISYLTLLGLVTASVAITSFVML
jgi:hypothetical protein